MSYKAQRTLPDANGDTGVAAENEGGNDSLVSNPEKSDVVRSTEFIPPGRPVLVKRLETPSAQAAHTSDENIDRTGFGETRQNSGDNDELILTRIDSPDSLVSALEHAAKRLAQGLNIWLLYPRHCDRGDGVV